MKQNIFLINKENGKVIELGEPKNLELPAESQVSSEALRSPQEYAFNVNVESSAIGDIFKTLSDKIHEEMAEYYKELDLRIEYALRNKIDKPINGEITKGKLKWRGISLGVFRGDGDVGYALLQRGAIVPFDFVNDKQYQIWRLRTLLERMQEEWNQKPIDENSKEYKKFEEMANKYAELLADEMSQSFNTFHEMSEETAQTLETLYESLIITKQ
jgi:hypothetical protein